MKRPFLYVFVLLAAAVSLHAQAAPDATELTRLLNEFLAGAGRNDAAAHDRFWAEDLIYTRSAGVRINKEELMKSVRSAPAPKPGDPITVYTAEEVRIRQYGAAAVVAFKLIGATTKSDGTGTVSNHLNTGTFIKRKGKWQVVAWQATTVPKPETAVQAEAEPTGTKPPTPSTVSIQPAGPSTTTRVYHKGPRGGCYYLNSKGTKIYVNHDLCK